MAKKSKSPVSPVVEALGRASAGLMYPSETDAPFEPFEWPGQEGKPTRERVLELAGLSADTPVRTKTLDAFFREVTTPQDWQDDQEKARVRGFQGLVQTLEDTLKDIRVFVAGRGEADVFIVGRTDSGWAGLKTKV